MAGALARRGVRTIAGAVVADPRRIGADEPIADAEGADEEPVDATEDTPPGKLSPRVPLVVNHGLMLIRVRPGAEPGAPAEVITTPADPSFAIHNGAVTKAKRRSRVTVRLSVNGSRIQIDVAGRVSAEGGGIVFRRRVPHQALYAASLMRASLQSAGITVRDDARVAPTPPQKAGRVLPLLAVHESAPLGILLRKINKDSDNDYAERVLEAAGAEVYGGAPTGDKGVRLLREVIGELGLPPGSYVPKNGSGLGHANRITADAMSALLRTLYLDPRVGPGDPAVAVGRRRRRHHAEPLQGDDRRRTRAREDRHAARQVVPLGPGGRRLRRPRVLDPGGGDPGAAPGRGARRAGGLRERDDALRARGDGGPAGARRRARGLGDRISRPAAPARARRRSRRPRRPRAPPRSRTRIRSTRSCASSGRTPRPRRRPRFRRSRPAPRAPDPAARDLVAARAAGSGAVLRGTVSRSS